LDSNVAVLGSGASWEDCGPLGQDPQE
jgi:hypothetical protein